MENRVTRKFRQNNDNLLKEVIRFSQIYSPPLHAHRQEMSVLIKCIRYKKINHVTRKSVSVTF